MSTFKAEKFAEFKRKLTPYLEDERKGSIDYEDFAIQANALGLVGEANALRQMASDERRHHDTIDQIVHIVNVEEAANAPVIVKESKWKCTSSRWHEYSKFDGKKGYCTICQQWIDEDTGYTIDFTPRKFRTSEQDQRFKEKLPELMGENSIQELWIKACEYDHIPPNSKFVTFSKDNPYAKQYNDALIAEGKPPSWHLTKEEAERTAEVKHPYVDKEAGPELYTSNTYELTKRHIYSLAEKLHDLVYEDQKRQNPSFGEETWQLWSKVVISEKRDWWYIDVHGARFSVGKYTGDTYRGSGAPIGKIAQLTAEDLFKAM